MKKIIYERPDKKGEYLPHNFEEMDVDKAIEIARANPDCSVFDTPEEFADAFNEGEISDQGVILVVGKDEPNFTDAERNLIKESILCKVRQDSRASKQITNQQAISLIEAEKQTLIGLLNRF